MIKDHTAIKTEQTREKYSKDGFVFPIEVLSADEVRFVRTDFEKAEDELSDYPEKLALLKSYPDRLLPSFDELIRKPELVKAAEAVLGPDLLVWSAALFIKEPKSPKIVSWHQDLTYWGLDDAEETTCWVALSNANVASGCMKFVPWSHKERQIEHVDTFDKNNLLTRGQEIAVDVDENDSVAIELRAGQASMHHGHLFHASGPNTTSDRRIGSAIRYIKTSMRQNSGEKALVAHVAGEDRYKNFNVSKAPNGRLHEDDFALCKSDAELKRKILYEDAASSSRSRY
ncbi:MAG: phytanoyl-CoA dioxygenase [Rhodobacteraceae bacterium]|nr:phytanoyl-CoA dioxygenase [Paracoccaceae bacterium]